MRVLILLGLIALAACGDPASDETGASGGEAPASAAPEVQLPASGTLGAVPPSEASVVITVVASGDLIVDGEPCAWDALAARIAARVGSADDEEVEEEETTESSVLPNIEDVIEAARPTRKSQTPGPREPGSLGGDGSSNFDALLRIDKRVPWELVRRIVSTCAHPDLKVWRIFYAVRDARGGSDGAMAIFLPKDMGCGPASELELDIASVRIRARPGTAPVTPIAEMPMALRQRMATPETILAVEVDALSDTPYGDVIQVFDAALQAGGLGLTLAGGVPVEKSAAALCRDVGRLGSTQWRISGQALMTRPTAPAIGPHRAKGYAGVRNALPVMPEIEEVLLEDD